MKRTLILAILCCVVGVLESEAQQGLVFADGFEDGTVCSWSAWYGIRWYEDLDGDGFGKSDTFVATCSPPAGWVALDGDCDDSNPGIFPGATDVLIDGSDQAVVLAEGSDCSFHLSTTADLLSGPPTSPRVFFQPAGSPKVATGNLIFDALYTLALVEADENSVDQLQAIAYNGGSPIVCPAGGCFVSSRSSTWIRTDDAAIAVDLGLAALDPTRALNTLEFKLSDLRGGGDPQIVQEPGTGGSYPVSTDRAIWALGARRLVGFLDGTRREAFIDAAWDAVKNNVEHDRETVFDHTSGLYSGELSFLNWREQSYPDWVADDPVQIATSQCLSTNATHLEILEFGAWLAGQRGDAARQTLFQGWADELRTSIDQALYLPSQEMWSSFTPGDLDRSAVHRFDLFGSALAVIAGVGDPSRRTGVVRGYPHLPKGAPVIWPQQKLIPIQHNRAMWPFVTATFMRAARQVRNDAAINNGVNSMMRGAAINLSNLDAFEFVTGAPWVEDGQNSGPVTNSQRSLRSVAGYLSMVHDVFFGLETTVDGIRFRPYVTRELRNSLFADTDSLVLTGFPYLGRHITVRTNLPPIGPSVEGAYSVGDIRLNGLAISAAFIDPSVLLSENLLEVDLVDVPEAADSIALVTDTSSEQVLFGPSTPRITSLSDNGGYLEIVIDPNGEPVGEIAFNIYRDGLQVASALPGSTTTWVDSGAPPSGPSYCYTVESYFTTSGNHSQHARPVCWFGSFFGRIQSYDATSFVAVGGTLVNQYSRFYYQNWGEPGHTLTLHGVTAAFTGEHLLQVTYGNGAGTVSTGITCAVKRFEVVDELSSAVVGSGLLVMPHLGSWDRWSNSNLVPVNLESGRSYRITIFHDASCFTMSDLEYNEIAAGTGGSSGEFHNVNIADLKLISKTENP